jgi:hypothetical protein
LLKNITRAEDKKVIIKHSWIEGLQEKAFDGTNLQSFFVGVSVTDRET